MCGIAGSFRVPFDVEAALTRIQHRGPDGRAVKQHGEATHGHVRLSLVDLSDASAQPFTYRKATLSFVGELWNFQTLRDELRKLGHRFKTTGDTEVLAAALDQWGLEALPRLDGMFTFAWSSADGQHILARDRFGKVPLYVRRLGKDGVVWSSERKGLGGLSADTLPPAAVVDLETCNVTTYYRPPRIDDAERSPEELLEQLRHGVRRRLFADAPVCCLVSGGLDSSLILRLACEVTKPVAYTAVCDPEAADLRAAREICSELDVELREVVIDRPTADAAAAAITSIEIPSKAQIEIAVLCIPLARQIAADGFKACLSGEAADELFGGYGNMMIQSRRCDDNQWRTLRLAQVSKMARGNFVRCNKSFMAEGVECRLPFMDLGVVEPVLSMTKEQCPPGKGLLKDAAELVLPRSIVRRVKETFQGGSGVSDILAAEIHNPTRFYNAEWRRQFG